MAHFHPIPPPWVNGGRKPLANNGTAGYAVPLHSSRPSGLPVRSARYGQATEIDGAPPPDPVSGQTEYQLCTAIARVGGIVRFQRPVRTTYEPDPQDPDDQGVSYEIVQSPYISLNDSFAEQGQALLGNLTTGKAWKGFTDVTPPGIVFYGSVHYQTLELVPYAGGSLHDIYVRNPEIVVSRTAPSSSTNDRAYDGNVASWAWEDAAAFGWRQSYESAVTQAGFDPYDAYTPPSLCWGECFRVLVAGPALEHFVVQVEPYDLSDPQMELTPIEPGVSGLRVHGIWTASLYMASIWSGLGNTPAAYERQHVVSAKLQSCIKPFLWAADDWSLVADGNWYGRYAPYRVADPGITQPRNAEHWPRPGLYLANDEGVGVKSEGTAGEHGSTEIHFVARPGFALSRTWL